MPLLVVVYFVVDWFDVMDVLNGVFIENMRHTTAKYNRRRKNYTQPMECNSLRQTKEFGKLKIKYISHTIAIIGNRRIFFFSSHIMYNQRVGFLFRKSVFCEWTLWNEEKNALNISGRVHRTKCFFFTVSISFEGSKRNYNRSENTLDLCFMSNENNWRTEAKKLNGRNNKRFYGKWNRTPLFVPQVVLKSHLWTLENTIRTQTQNFDGINGKTQNQRLNETKENRWNEGIECLYLGCSTVERFSRKEDYQWTVNEFIRCATFHCWPFVVAVSNQQ